MVYELGKYSVSAEMFIIIVYYFYLTRVIKFFWKLVDTDSQKLNSELYVFAVAKFADIIRGYHYKSKRLDIINECI